MQFLIEIIYFKTKFKRISIIHHSTPYLFSFNSNTYS